MSNFKLMTLIVAASIAFVITSSIEVNAIEMNDSSYNKKAISNKMSEWNDHSTTNTAMGEKKSMMGEANISDLKKLVSNIEKSLTSDQKAKPEIKNALVKLKTAVSSIEKAMSGMKMTDKKSMMGKNNMSRWADHTMPDKSMSNKAMTKGSNEKIDKKILSIGGVDLSSASPVFGSKDAKVTIIEFGDYQCPKCDQWFLNERPAVESQYIAKNQANLYFVDFPFLGPDSEMASVATYCADEQGKYWDYHSTLYKNQGGIQSGWANSDSLKKFASSISLDTEKFNKCLDGGKYSDRVKKNKEIGSSSGVEGTPTFLLVGLNGKIEKIVGPQPSSVFASTIEKLLK